MAEENQDGQEKTEEPTPKRRREAREEGQVPRSRELTTLLVMVGSAGALLALGEGMATGLARTLESAFQADRELIFDPKAPLELLGGSLWRVVGVVGPFAVIMLVLTVAASSALGGLSFSVKALAPKFEKLNPLKGLKRIFGVNGLMELAKALVKVIIVGAIGGTLFWLSWGRFEAIAAAPLESGMALASHVFFYTFLAVSAVLIIPAAADVPYQLWEHTRKLRMTRQELKEEFKQTEGRPEVKSRIRGLQQRMAQGRMMEKVPEADVVVTNPTHFAVALKYDQLRMGAPRVVAKGTDRVAARIRELAAEHRVALFEAPPLARALYHHGALDQEIPAGLYLAVAQVLAYVYQLRGPRQAGHQGPARPAPEVPEEFQVRPRGRRARR